MAMTMTTAAIHSRPTLTPTAIPIMTVLSAHLPKTKIVVLLQSQAEMKTKFTLYTAFAVDNDMRTRHEICNIINDKLRQMAPRPSSLSAHVITTL